MRRRIFTRSTACLSRFLGTEMKNCAVWLRRLFTRHTARTGNAEHDRESFPEKRASIAVRLHSFSRLYNRREVNGKVIYRKTPCKFSKISWNLQGVYLIVVCISSFWRPLSGRDQVLLSSTVLLPTVLPCRAVDRHHVPLVRLCFRNSLF